MFNLGDRSRAIAFLSLACLVLCGIAGAAPSITLSKKSGPPTSQILVSGRGFEPNVGVDIFFDTKDKALVVTNDKGEFDKAGIQVPRSARPGKYWVSAIERNNDKGAQEPFLVRTDWPTFGFNDHHSGENPYENILGPGNVANLSIRWMSFNGGAGLPPAIYHGLAYSVSGDGVVYAMNASTGTQVWTYSVGVFLSSSPAIVDGVVYFTSNYGFPANVYALDASTGALQWKLSIGSQSTSSPVVVDGALYVGSEDGALYALNARKGTLNWKYQTGGDVDSSPAVANGVVYVGSWDTNLYALNATTGALLWKYPTQGEVNSSPAVVDGVVYFGSDDGNVYALDAGTGVLLWRFTTEGSVDSSPAVANGLVFVGSNYSSLYALNASEGTVRWVGRYPSGWGVPDGPVVANGVVYVSVITNDFLIWVLDARDAATGDRFWEYTDGSIISAPVVANGLLYANSASEGGLGSLYAFGLGGR
jgi:outer membrane protein assembly factor BamB